jgi:hypothetical protein
VKRPTPNAQRPTPKAKRRAIIFAPGAVTKPGTTARAVGESGDASREHRGPGANLLIVSTNGERLKRQGEIFNHSGECGRITLRKERA